MAIDDNKSYALTGAQVKDLATKIKAKANTTDLPSVMTGATAQTAGTSGLVPAPTTSDVDKYLKGDGTWEAVSSGSSDAITLYCYYNNSTDEITPYYDAAHTQVVSWSDFVRLVDSKTVMMTWNDYENLPLTHVIISSWYDRNDGGDSDFYFRLVDDYGIWQLIWNSADSYFTFSGNPVIGKTEGTRCFYATSSSGASTSSKTASIADGQGVFSLKAGVTVFVKFSYQNTSSGTLYLNVGGTGLKQVYVTGYNTDGSYLWNDNDIVGFVYDGTFWRMLGGGKATTSSYGKVKLSSSWANNDSTVVPTSAHLYQVYLVADGKQDQLTAGTGITIDQNNVISATGGSYTYSGSVDTINNSFTTTLSDGTTNQGVSLNAGTGITFSSTTTTDIVGPTPANSGTISSQLTGLTFTPGAAGEGHFYILRVSQSGGMTGLLYQATLYESRTTYSFTTQSEVEQAILPNGMIDVDPSHANNMMYTFDSYFQQIEQSQYESTPEAAIAAVYTAAATFGGTVTFQSSGSGYVYADSYVYVITAGSSTFTVSTNLYTTTGQNTDGSVTQKLFTDTVGDIETILQTLNTGTGV